MNIGFDENTAVEEFIIDIRDKNQVVKHRYALNSKDIEKNILMSEHYIELEEFVLDIFIKFERTDYIIWEGEKYMIKEDYIPDQVNKFNYKYTLRFDHWTTFLQDDTFYYTNQNLEEADWSLMSNAATHFQLIADNANRYFGVNTFNVGTIEFAEMKLLQFSKVSIWNAATLIADAYKAEWYLTGTTFHLVKKFSYGSEIDFESEVSVEKMDRSEGENSEKYTRILSFGSTRNIPANYRETTPTEAVDAIYQKRLRIPESKGNFIDIRPNLSPEEVKSAVVIFDDIYPKRIGTMSSISTVEYTETDETTGVVTKWNAYRYKDTGLSFKEKYRLPGIELRIAFQSGVLNGTDYEVKFNPLGKAETDPESQLFEIIRNEDYGKALPNDILKPQNGDTFILYGFDIKLVSDQYVPAGELDLYNTATQWLADNNKDKSVFECPTMMQHFEANEMDLELGQKVKLMHSQFEGGFRSSRIQGYEKHLLNKYQATYTVGDNATYSWPKDIEESIKELQIAGITYQATGRNGVYLITRFDNTPPSDYNAYSAKASDARFFNKQTGGTVQGDTTFQKKVKAKEVVSDQFGNETFTSGQFGNGFRFWVENGLSFGQLDYLTITREMLISVLTVAEVKSVDGGIIVSAANMVSNKVEDLTSGYKCYFDNDNGNIPNKFTIGDQAICRRFNGANVKYYWRLVLEIGTNYILLSKTDKDGTAIPSAKDNIVQFGNRTNAQRQFAVYTVGYGDAGTYYYYGVNSYDLTGKAKTYFDKTGARIDGDSIIFSSSGKSATTVINESKQEAISTAATDATNKVDSIQVGGRNLFLNSDFNNILRSWALNLSTTASVISDSTFGQCAKVIISAKNGGIYQNPGIRRTSGKNYVITGYIRSDSPMSVWILHEGGTGSKYVNVTTEWQRYETQGVWNTNGSVCFYGQSAGTFYLANPQYEEGNKSSAWSLAPEDVQAGITAAQTAATNAATTASNAQTSANTANSLLADIANDNLLIPSEKQDVLKEWQIIQGEYPTVVAQATTYSVSSSDYTTKYNALNTYITPLLSNMTTNSAIVGATFRSTFKAYYDAKIALLKLVTDKAKTIADQAQSSADTANAGLLTKVAYSEYNAQMQILNNQISSKVSQTDFNSLNQRVGTTESQITQQAGQITSVVEKVDNIQVGANNLYPKSSTWVKIAGTGTITHNQLDRHGKNEAVKFEGTSLNSRCARIVKENGIYSFGFWAKSLSGNSSFSVDICDKFGKPSTFTVGEEWVWIKSEGASVDNYSVSVFNFVDIQVNGAVLACDFKLEKGNKCTDWTPASEDVQASIDNAQATANSKNRTYYQDAQPTTPSGGFSVGDIWQKVTYTDISGIINSDATKNVCRLEYRWNGTTWVKINENVSGSYVTQTNDSITSLVTKTGINGLGVGETLKSLIDQTPGQIQLAVSTIQIGGRNLIRLNKLTGIPIEGKYNDLTGRYVDTSILENWRFQNFTQSERGKYSVSFWMKSEIAGKVLFDICDQNGRELNITTDWILFRLEDLYVTNWLGNPYYGFVDFQVPTSSTVKGGKLYISNLMIEYATKCSTYSLAPEDVQAEITAAQTAATNAATAASNADAKATTANNLLTDIANDNRLDPAEKQSAKKEWDIIVSEYSKNITQANSFTVSTTVYTSAYNALSSYITPLLTNLTTTSDIVGTTFRSNFKAYYDARTDLLNAVSTKAKAIADSKTDLDTVKAGITINADGLTAFGNQFKVDTTLIANAIQTNELNVGNGNFKVGTDGKISAKGAALEGSLEIGWDGDTSKPVNRITVVDRSSSTQKTKVLITPQNITSRGSIGGNTTTPPVVSGGAATSRTVFAGDPSLTWNGASIVLSAGKTYDVVVPAIALTASGSGNGVSGFDVYLDNLTTGEANLVAARVVGQETYSINQAITLSGLQAGTYRLRIALFAYGTSSYSSFSIPANAAYTVRPITDAVEIGANGICGIFTSGRYFHFTTDGFYVRMGNHGFRITEDNGIQRSSNMQLANPTWATL